MREILRSNDAVLISFAQSLLRQAGIGTFLADQHISLTTWQRAYLKGAVGAPA